jgi:translation initiation factor IF-2
MSVRAYKIAEELGIERNEFVEKAREFGVELRNAMAPLDEDQVTLLRDKLSIKTSDLVTEARVDRKGSSVIRRRKKVAPVEPAAPVEIEGRPGPASTEAEPVVAAEATPAEDAAEPTAPAESEAPVAPEPEPEAVRPAAAAAPSTGPETPREGTPRARPATRDDAAAERQTRKQFKEVVNLREQEQLARQVTSRSGIRQTVIDPRAYTNPRRKRRDALPPRRAADAAAKAPKRIVRVEGTISVGELARQLGAKAAQVQGKLMATGTMVSINQTVDIETAGRLAKEFGFEVQDVGFQEQEFLEAPVAEGEDTAAEKRPVVVTVMGHVDHGKTSLLDAIRETDVVAGEAGGITQHIGAYQVTAGGHAITFIDTPGHAAFTAMRARGAQVTDLVIIVVAASEGIMPQTIEAIDHAKAAGVPMVVAINKIDLPDADSRLTRQRLMEHGIVLEDFGGEVLAVDVSAIKKMNLDKLLEAVVLQAELIEPKADPARRAKGAVLESSLDRGRGPVATVLVQDGTLHAGDIVVVGRHWGRVRMMTDHRGDTVKEAPPSMPVRVVGLSGVPEAGDVVHAVESERVAKDIVANREAMAREQAGAPTRPRVSLEELFAAAEGDGPKELRVIVKADVQGSAEALREALIKQSNDKVKVNVLHVAVGGITESDIQLAVASEAVVVGFHVRPDAKARKLADGSGVDVRVYQVIYEAIDEVRAAMAGLLPPTLKEVVLGQAEVRKTFTIPKAGTVAGCYVTDGLMRRAARSRLVRDGVQVFDGKFASLKRFKDDVREVQTGFECGIGLEGYNDVKTGDVIEAYEIQEQAAQL